MKMRFPNVNKGLRPKDGSGRSDAGLPDRHKPEEPHWITPSVKDCTAEVNARGKATRSKQTHGHDKPGNTRPKSK